jgi:2'-5' RNA ligase
VRLFIAVELPGALREELAHGIAELRRLQPPARWVRAEGIHLTLKFLGEQPADIVERLDAEVRPHLATLEPVSVAPGGGGFFPSEHRARVAWLGGEAPGLDAWAEVVETAAEGVGTPRERRPFALHLTLARLERPWPREAADRYLRIVGDWRLEPFVAREAVLFRSELRPGGAIYTVLRRWAVGGGG